MLFWDNSGGSDNYREFELRIETGTEQTTTIIVDIFDIIQTVRNTCIHLRVDEEQWKISQGSKRGKLVGVVPTCSICQGYDSQILLMHSKKKHGSHV